MQFDEVEKAMIQVVKCHFELIFGLLTNPKCELVELQIAMIEVFAWHSQLIFDLCTSPKSDLMKLK